MAETSRSLLLLSPAFHGYWESISAPLTDLGYAVRPHLYNRSNTLWSKVRTKVAYELPHRIVGGSSANLMRRIATQGAIEALRDTNPDIVVAIKADIIGQEFWDEVHDRKIPHVLWLYDEIRRMRHTHESLSGAVGDQGHLVTYSRLDLAALTDQGFAATYLPNAFDARYEISPRPSPEIVFVGARYPNREDQLSLLHRHGIPVRAVGRDWSHHWFDRARTWGGQRPDLPWDRDVDRATAYAMLGGAAAALNVHNDQDGFTMRTFEIPGSGGLQLIDRPDVEEFYEPGREVLVYRSGDELVDLCRRALRDRDWAAGIGRAARARTLTEHTFAHRMATLESLWA